MKANRFLTYTAMALGTTALAGPVIAADGESEATFQVFFPIDSAEIDAEANQEISEAADAWEREGAGDISVIGHSDTSGAAEYNMRLSERRAGAVEDALAREGVPAGRISIEARGQEELLVPTADGVSEEANRRVEILVPIVEREVVEETAEPAPPPEPLPAATRPSEPAVDREPESDIFTFALGPVWGKNFGENDNGAENDMVGAELTFRALPGFLGGVSLSQMGVWAFNAIDEGLTGRTVASLDFAPDFGIFRPTLAVNGGLVYGEGVQDGFVVGPELRFDVVPIAGFNIGLKVAYDYQFETNDLEEGIVWTGLDLGLRF